MIIPQHIQQPVEEFLSDRFERPVKILRAAPVGGGSISHAALLETEKGKYFLKWNADERAKEMFVAEGYGLYTLAETKTFVVPDSHGTGIGSGKKQDHWLLMDYLEKSQPTVSGWFEAGVKLAALHRHTKTEEGKTIFGFTYDNFIGQLKQSNRTHFSWSSFYAEERILPMTELARNSGAFEKKHVLLAEKFCERIADIFPEEKPSLLHGDLWNGNFMFTTKGPAVFDPAVYYGHREMDLAMTKLFGGFADDFYTGYCESFAPEKNWKQRTDYCNLYPLMVHLNLFGAGYLHDVLHILKPFG